MPVTTLVRASMYKIAVHNSSTTIESEITGFLSVPEVVAYAREVEPLIHRFAARGSYRMLIDVSGCAIQQQEVVIAFQEHVASVPRAKRLAVVTGNSIVRMQVRRILIGRSMQLFTDRQGALAWLWSESRSEASVPDTAPAS